MVKMETTKQLISRLGRRLCQVKLNQLDGLKSQPTKDWLYLSSAKSFFLQDYSRSELLIKKKKKKRASYEVVDLLPASHERTLTYSSIPSSAMPNQPGSPNLMSPLCNSTDITIEYMCPPKLLACPVVVRASSSIPCLMYLIVASWLVGNS